MEVPASLRPVTAEGKKRVSRSAIKHGLATQSLRTPDILLPGESHGPLASASFPGPRSHQLQFRHRHSDCGQPDQYPTHRRDIDYARNLKLPNKPGHA